MNLREAAQYPRLNYTKCVNGIAEAIPGDAASTFKCKDVSPATAACSASHSLLTDR
jgi:hypothetical protein